MIRFSRGLMAGAAFGLCLNCGPSSPSDDTAGSAGAASGSTGGSGNPGSSGSTSSAGSSNSSGAPSNAGAPSSSGNSDGADSLPVITTSAKELAAKLGRPPNFLVGMGNDLAGANENYDHNQDVIFTLGQTLDLHYAYLSAYRNNGAWGSWKDWNTDGAFVNIITDTTDAHGVVPMFTLYSMAAAGDGVLSGLNDAEFQRNYWGDVKLLFQRLAMFNKPAVVHFEPDFWAYAQQQSNGDPTALKVALRAAAPDCGGMSEDLVGMGHCIIKLARTYAPKVLVGFHASQWAGDGAATAAFLKKVGADKSDVIFADMLDRDAGCFEAAVDPNCSRGGSNLYWDETNTKSPNFHEYLAWSKAISAGVGRPMMWWQVPFGVPSDTPGGTAGHYRDNRVHYLFSHVQEFVDAGGLGVVFGAGVENQTSPLSDGGQFKDAVTNYFKAPVPL